MIKQLTAARSVSTPLVCIRTPDPASTILAVVNSLGKEIDNYPVLAWDVLTGLTGVNAKGKATAKALLEGGDPAMVTARPSEMLAKLAQLSQQKAGADTVVFMLNAHRFWNDEVTVQGIWNLRNPFKANGSILLMLTSAGATLPAELADDVLVLDEALPNETEIRQLVQDVYKSAEFEPPSEDVLTKATDATLGLAAFPAEQRLAMSLTRKGLDMVALWEGKRQAIEQTPGLSVWRGGEKFDAVGGCENIKTFARAVIKGEGSPRLVLFLDEIEKSIAGNGTDTSGVKTEMVGTLLTWMQDKEADGMIFIGPPGAAKSAIAKATGNEAGVPTVAFDLAAMQDSLVGKSGERLRAALKVVDAMSQGRTLMVATCNSIASLPPELRRRFTLGVFFFPLPAKADRELIWDIYERKYFGAPGDPKNRPEDAGWTGAEIKECVRKASRLKMTLKDAAAYIVPVSVSAGEQIKRLSMEASGKFISACKPGLYEHTEEQSAPSSTRKIKKADLNFSPEVGNS
jgi:hypothetical protein